MEILIDRLLEEAAMYGGSVTPGRGTRQEKRQRYNRCQYRDEKSAGEEQSAAIESPLV